MHLRSVASLVPLLVIAAAASGCKNKDGVAVDAHGNSSSDVPPPPMASGAALAKAPPAPAERVGGGLVDSAAWPRAGRFLRTVAVEGAATEQSYVVQVPSGFDKAKTYELIVAFPDKGQSAEQLAESKNGLSVGAGRAQRLIAFLEQGAAPWKGGACSPDQSDAPVVNAVVADLQKDVALNDKAITLLGHGTGAEAALRATADIDGVNRVVLVGGAVKCASGTKALGPLSAGRHAFVVGSGPEHDGVVSYILQAASCGADPAQTAGGDADGFTGKSWVCGEDKINVTSITMPLQAGVFPVSIGKARVYQQLNAFLGGESGLP